MNILKRIFTSLSVVILAACCGAFVLFGFSGTGWKALAIPTGSMRPGMPPGSLALVHSVPTSTLKVGDVITYTNPLSPKTTISHRIIKTYLIGGKVPGFITKGDANKSADIPIAAGSVKGQVVWHVPYVGYGLLAAKEPIVILPIVYIAGLLIMIEEVRRLANYLKSSQPYQVLGFARDEGQPNVLSRKLAYVTTLSAVFIMVIGAIAAPTALALLKSNTVTLGPNNLTVAAVQHQCSGNTHNNTSINVNNTSTQTSTSGSTTVSGNTNGGSSTSGSATNNNSTTVNINVTNCH